MRRGINRAMPGQRSNLRIITVFSGTAIHSGLSRIKRGQLHVDRFQAESVHGRSRCGLCRTPERLAQNRSSRQRVVRHGQFFTLGGLCFIRENIDRPNFRPFHAAVYQRIAEHIVYAVPYALFVFDDIGNLYGCVTHEIASIGIFVCFQEHSGILRDSQIIIDTDRVGFGFFGLRLFCRFFRNLCLFRFLSCLFF